MKNFYLQIVSISLIISDVETIGFDLSSLSREIVIFMARGENPKLQYECRLHPEQRKILTIVVREAKEGFFGAKIGFSPLKSSCLR